MKNSFLIIFFFLQYISYSQNLDSIMTAVDQKVAEDKFEEVFSIISDLKSKSTNKTNDYYIDLINKEASVYLFLTDYVNAIKLYKEALSIPTNVKFTY